jgi:membrane protein YqaA with SNARE-associated domain
VADFAAYGGLFLAAFLAATLLPAQSEAVLVGLLLQGGQPAVALVAVASIGNVLGAVVNWVIGRQAERFRGRRWFPVSGDRLDAARGWYTRYGRWSLLFSWLPIVGDPLTVAAGVLREPLASFLVLVAIGKIGRYLVLAATTVGW